MVSDRRYGRYRGIILALVGIALSGASPQKADKSEPPDHSSGQIANSLESIASILKDAQKPSKHDEPCPEGDDDRSSDLCAQWKAADATKSGTTATWLFGAIGSVIGLLTLGAAGAAAFYAREAARHTHTGAKEAKRSADAAEEAMHTAMNAYEMQIRPYVAITVQDDSDRAPFSRETVHKFCIKNFGQIPATSVRLTLGEATCHEPIGAFVVSLGEKTGDYGLLAPQDFRTETIHSRGLLPSEIAEWASGRVKFLVRLRIDYTWPEGSDHHDITMILENVATNEWSLLTEERRQRLPQTE